MLLAIGAICVLIFDDKVCQQVQLRAALGIIFGVWCLVFILLLLHVIGCVKCFKKIPKVMFGFYCTISVSMWFSQMLLFSAPPDPTDACSQQAPLLYWYLFSNVMLFYLIVAFGLTTWGQYLCSHADIKEEITRAAIDEYLKENQMQSKHFTIAVGTQKPMMLEAPKATDVEKARRQLMLESQAAIVEKQLNRMSNQNLMLQLNATTETNSKNNKQLALPGAQNNNQMALEYKPPSQAAIGYK